MGRRLDGHAWSHTITSNIQNDLKFLCCTSSCSGHLRCDNPACEYLQRDHKTSKVNETEWEGLSEKLLEARSKPPTGSSIVYKSYNIPPTCVVVCTAKIHYVTWLGLVCTWDLTTIPSSHVIIGTSSIWQTPWLGIKSNAPHQPLVVLLCLKLQRKYWAHSSLLKKVNHIRSWSWTGCKLFQSV